MLVESYVYLDEIKCLILKGYKFIDRHFISWHAYGEYMVLNPIFFRWRLVYNTSVLCFSHFHLEWVGGWSEPNETNFIWKKTVTFWDDPLIIWNRHDHECSRIWKLSVNFTLIQCIKKCRDFLGRDISWTTFF